MMQHLKQQNGFLRRYKTNCTGLYTETRRQFDVSIAKNYLTEFELSQLERLVNAYLDIAEDMALRKIPMTMEDWESRLNAFIKATDRKILSDAGKVTAEIARQHAESEYEKYRIVQDLLFESDFERFLSAENEAIDDGL